MTAEEQAKATYWAGWWASQTAVRAGTPELARKYSEIAKAAFDAGYKCAQAERVIGRKRR